MHSPDSELPVVDVSIVLRDEAPGAVARLLAALREEALVGAVLQEEHRGLLSCWLVAGHDGLLLRAAPGGLEPGLAVEVVAARLSRALDGAVLADLSDVRPDDPEVRVEPAGFDPAGEAEARAATAGDDLRLVSLVPLPAAQVLPRLPELAQSTGARTVLVPAGERSLVVGESGAFPQWWRAAMPVVSVVAEPASIALHVQRRARLTVPELVWGAVWAAPPLPIQGDGAHPAVLAAQGPVGAFEPLEVPDEAVARALGWDERAVAALLSIPRDERPTAARVVEAMGAPEAMARILDGADPALEPGATAYEPTGMGATLADAMILASRPKGDGWWSRYERWWWRRPGFSTGVGVALLVLVAVLAAAATVGDSWSWWRAIICAVGALNGISLLGSTALARRERRQQAAS